MAIGTLFMDTDSNWGCEFQWYIEIEYSAHFLCFVYWKFCVDLLEIKEMKLYFALRLFNAIGFVIGFWVYCWMERQTLFFLLYLFSCPVFHSFLEATFFNNYFFPKKKKGYNTTNKLLWLSENISSKIFSLNC